MTEGIELLLGAKPFSCECGGTKFKHTVTEDSWKCDKCGARYRREDGGRIAGTGTPESEG